MQRLRAAHVLIVGVGGVGSWAAESLVRSGVGRLSLVDFDEVCVTNANRQLHALQNTIGRQKAEAMADRLRLVNPQAEITAIPKFYSAESSEELLGTSDAPRADLILDCSDNVTAKCHLIATCYHRGFKLITSGGAGSRQDPTQIRIADLSETYMDPFLSQVRKWLHTRHDLPNDRLLGISCVFTTEPPAEPFELEYDKGKGFRCVCPHGQNDFHSCERRNVIHGTASFVTGTFGLFMASQAVRIITQDGSTQKISTQK
jgi:tRNA A37 threonylcarbamoyladenosine dehydratase